MEFKILLKKINNILTEEEKIQFDDWYNESPKHREYFAKLKANHLREKEAIDLEKGWKAIQQKISKKRKNYFKYGVAASIILVIGLGIIFNYLQSNDGTPILLTKNDNKITPGTHKAILTLEDGSEVFLQKGVNYHTATVNSTGEKIEYTSSQESQIESAKVTSYNTLTVERGGEFFVSLSDDSKIWLNSDTKIRYPVNFIEGQTREIELIYGEAYFDISPSNENSGAGFNVKSDWQQIKVLGTEFNVKSYPEEDKITTTLVEGKVLIQVNNENVYLEPNHKAVLNKKNNTAEVLTSNVFRETSWKDGLFLFKKSTLEDIMVTLSRWYDITVNYEDKGLKKLHFTGELKKYETVNEHLNMISKTTDINFSVKGKEVIVTRKK